jgi:asparagine synthase (glutamine-hydrolysing)
VCGFAGVYEYGTTEGAVTHGLIAAMRDTLRHRGPDGEGKFVSEDARVGLGHRRLAIVDLDGGAQPIFGQRGECLVYNGEIYNYPRLRAELEADGVQFATDCDTEVVLRLYERSGADCLKSLDGMFAFALWDPVRRRLLLARDRLGEKPLYWSNAGGRLVFGSEVKALLAHPAIDPELNEAALGAYLTHLVTPAPQTLLRGIFKLGQGELAICDASGMRVSRYWDLFQPRQWNEASLDSAGATVRSLLEQSLQERLMSDVPVGVLLSGGLDSTALVALLHERARGLATFSVGFAGSRGFDEREQARRVARHFGTDHHEVSVSERDALGFLPRLIHHQDEPLADAVGLPLHFVCELAASRGVKVVLGGEGSDELFWGYRRYERIVRAWPLIGAARRTPSALRRALAGAIPAARYPRAREFAGGVAAARMPPMHMPVGVPAHERDALLGVHSASTSADLAWAASEAPATGADPFDTLGFDTQEYEFGLRLPERLLMRLDRCSMASGVEARVPYLDRELVEFAYRLQPRLKVDDGRGKAVLRRAVADVVPAWVLARPKQGFDAPLADWFGSHVGGLLRSLGKEDCLRSCFDRDGLDGLLGARGPAHEARAALWPVLNFALWHMAWIEGRDLEAELEQRVAR